VAGVETAGSPVEAASIETASSPAEAASIEIAGSPAEAASAGAAAEAATEAETTNPEAQSIAEGEVWQDCQEMPAEEQLQQTVQLHSDSRIGCNHCLYNST
jgi:hypothetical protein